MRLALMPVVCCMFNVLCTLCTPYYELPITIAVTQCHVLQNSLPGCLLSLGQLILQDGISGSRPAAIPIKDIIGSRTGRHHFIPRPQLPELGFQYALQRINHLVTNDGEELVGMTTAASSEEKALVFRVVGDDKVAIRTGRGVSSGILQSLV